MRPSIRGPSSDGAVAGEGLAGTASRLCQFCVLDLGATRRGGLYLLGWISATAIWLLGRVAALLGVASLLGIASLGRTVAGRKLAMFLGSRAI
jgi:hypothetical protein